MGSLVSSRESAAMFVRFWSVQNISATDVFPKPGFCSLLQFISDTIAGFQLFRPVCFGWLAVSMKNLGLSHTILYPSFWVKMSYQGLCLSSFSVPIQCSMLYFHIRSMFIQHTYKTLLLPLRFPFFLAPCPEHIPQSAVFLVSTMFICNHCHPNFYHLIKRIQTTLSL